MTAGRVRLALAFILASSFCTSSPAAAEKFIPAAAHLPGGNATFFRTDVRIVNLASAPASFELTWLPSNDTPRKELLTISGRASVQIDDIVLSLFDVAAGGGMIGISSSADFVATSRTYTTSGDPACPGTFGQFIPAVEATAAVRRGIVANVQLSATAGTGSRTNAGFANPGSEAIDVTVRLRDGGGASRGVTTVTVPPLALTQIALATSFPEATGDNLFLEVEASAPVIAYASVVDNVSGDPIYVPASPDSGVPQLPSLTLLARQWEFQPAVIDARVGEETTIIARALDVDHGLGISGVGPVSCSSEQGGICVLRPGEDVTIRFTPREPGTFAFFCTRFCGASAIHSHETMRGSIVVR